MNRYTVTWLQGAQNQLAQIWIDAFASMVLAASAELARDPGNKGSELAEVLRTIYVPPLHVLFSVREQDRMVELRLVLR